ncbi:YkgJ family cysteine cluster protein [Desulfoluna spongiiphila]|uniref:Fe-S-cluster containining protein n=1 Tax=Desulfoluna spongiiphila TaxID=419481 RepID=A0A1G5GBI7_9BACT|nr:YkgJ family cysteine cluster protein [Desulfoluna spongiiphila]SCY48892.1 Fe-S-cluster containining protein [Desulfoluna spongiiphila]VVS93658.1 putative zinc- or iron-chelating domain containing protein [Desulfoluna spongiiphila]
MDALFENYRTLLARVSARCGEIEAALSGHMACRKGCSACCLNISLFPVEAVSLRLAFDTLSEDQKALALTRAAESSDEGPCPLLDGAGACLLYGYRPVICRTHGLPILFDDGKGNQRVDFCPENLQGLSSLSGDVMINLDPMNQMLAAVNAMFCDELFGTEAPFERLSIADTLYLDVA